MPRKSKVQTTTTTVDSPVEKSVDVTVEEVPKEQTPIEQAEEESGVRGKVSAWRGGVKIKLDRKTKSGKTLREELAQHVYETVSLELENHKELFDNIKRWNKLYKGQRDEKSYPYQGCANISSSVPRSDTDAIFVRAYDSLFNKRKIYLMKMRAPQDTAEQSTLREIEDAFNYYVKNELNIREKCRWPMMQGTKSGTGIIKIQYDTDTRTYYRYANQDELGNPDLEKYESADPDADKMVKAEAVIFRGPNLYAWPREDFLVSTDAYSIDSAYMVSARFHLRRTELDARAASDIYDADAVKKMTPDEFSENKKERVESHGLKTDKTDYEKPYEIWETWIKYDVDGDGQEDDIVVTHHLASKQIIDAIYNPIFYGYRPFVDMKGNPAEFAFDGEGVCEIIENTAEEYDAMHNLRLDRLAQINLPIVLIKPNNGIKKFTLKPGGIWYVDSQEDLSNVIRFIQFPESYNSLENELSRLEAAMDRSIGINPGSLGISTSERPVFKEMAALQEEANKKFKNWWDNFRAGLLEIGYKLLESFAQHQPQYTYINELGQKIVVKMPVGDIRNTIRLDLEVSSEQMNSEIRKQTDLLKYKIMQDYLGGLATMIQKFIDPRTPEDFKKYILAASDSGHKLMLKIMSDFDERDPDSLVPPMSGIVDVERGLSNTPENQPPAQPQGQAPGGQQIPPALAQAMAQGGAPGQAEIPQEMQ